LELAAGLVVADRFRLVRPLGQGGMGSVWLAQHTGLDTPCAVKFIHEHAARSPDIVARFEREAKAAAQLRSPHVVQILDHGVWQGAPYIAMELLEGEDLGQRLQRVGALSPRDTLAVAVQVGRALSKAHAAGLIHRDLKPANVFLVRDEEREIAKVLDFGVAKVQETGVDGNTKTGAILGTPYYMSPEQARGSKTIDQRSDLWALAVVVYQCLTGRLPFVGEALGDLFVKIIVEPLPVPSQVASVPPAFDGWWARAASRDPAQRFQTARELTDGLSLALGVTAADGVDVGSSMARPSNEPVPVLGSRGGTVAMTPSAPLMASSPTPAGAMRPPTTPFPSTPMPSGVTNPAAAPTPMQQAMSVPAPPPSGRGVVVAAAVSFVLALGGAGAFLALRGGSAPADARAPAAPAPPSAAPVAVSAMATATAAPDVTTAPTASAAASASAAPSASASASAQPGATHAKPKGKTDFGF
jgi:serine/threonine-protein kinase